MHVLLCGSSKSCRAAPKPLMALLRRLRAEAERLAGSQQRRDRAKYRSRHAGAPAATTILCEPAQGSAPSAAGWPTAARSRPIVGGAGARSTASSAARARSMPEIKPRRIRQFFDARRRSREVLNADERFATRSARRDGVSRGPNGARARRAAGGPYGRRSRERRGIFCNRRARAQEQVQAGR